MSSLAQVKAPAIRLQNESDGRRKRAADYKRKAMMLIRRADVGEVPADEAEWLDRLAAAALEAKADRVGGRPRRPAADGRPASRQG